MDNMPFMTQFNQYNYIFLIKLTG